MIHFTDGPPEETHGYGLDLIRTPQSKPLVAAVTCERLRGCPTHFWGGRTIPHDENDCEPCLYHSPWRWHGYVTAIDHKTGQHFLFESTARAAEMFKAWHKAHGTLRGSAFKAWRPSQRVNGRVTIELKSIDLIKFPLPEPPNIMAALAIIWNIPLADLFEGEPRKGHASIGTETGQAEAAAKARNRYKRPKPIPAPLPGTAPPATDEDFEELAKLIGSQTGGNGQRPPSSTCHEDRTRK